MPLPKYQFEALGTHWEIVSLLALSEPDKSALQAFIEDFDSTYSRFRPDSLVSKLALKAGVYTFPDNAAVLFAFYESLYDLTRGKVTPLIGGVLEDLGYDADYSFVAKRELRKAPNYKEAIIRDGTTLTVAQPVVFDVGAAGKGYLVDLIGQWLEVRGVHEYIIDAGGDMLHKGLPPDVVGLENPLTADSVIGEVRLQNGALCGSAVTRRSWGEGLHHVVDPETSLPTNTYVATWVMAESTMIADGLATALFFCDPNILRKQYTYEYIRMKSDGSAEYSSYFEGTLY